MRSIDPRFALVALLALAGCGGGASGSSSIPAGSLPSTQSVTRAPLSEHEQPPPGRGYEGIIQDQLPPCGAPSNSCTGKFAVTLQRNGTAISGTWTEDFTNPTLHDQGTFSGTMTGRHTFTAIFQSPTDLPCTITVAGKLTPGRFDATYKFDSTRACPVFDHGIIVLHHEGGDDEEDDHGDHGDHGGDHGE